MRPIRTVLVDDEPLARRGLELRLAEQPDVEIVAQAGDGLAAARAIVEHRPDLLFLDVQMPGLDGFEALGAMPVAQLPLTVFVTAHHHYAVRAFEACAVDYLLKPVEGRRFERAMSRVRTTLEGRDARGHRAHLLELLGRLSGRPGLQLEEALDAPDELTQPADAPLALRDGQRILRVPPVAVRWVDAAGDYACVHTDDGTHVLRATMLELERRLDPRRFPRIHRSVIVNAARVTSLRPHLNGEYFLTLDCGQELKLSRTYRERLALFR
ncbi:MAG: response regulator transcription factor [Polyangiaceae bacterium]|jgi:two-component system LytT family response regulator|nr:response regulator transcription factor [Polyangiaceae bacterium]